MKRTFIAIKIKPDDNLRQLMKDLRDSLSKSIINWVALENIHITLAFIGSTNDTDISAIQGILKSSCGNHMAFPLVFQNIDVFRSFKDPRVIWLGIKPSTELHDLREAICSNLNAKGIYNDTRPFRPHLSLGRSKLIRDIDNLSSIISRYRDRIIHLSMIEHVTFYESILKQEGPVYKVIGEYSLASLRILL